MSSPERSPVSRIVRCACFDYPQWRPDSWLVRFSPTTCWPMRCSRTSDSAEPAFGSSIPRSSRDSSKSSEPSMSNCLDRRTIARGIGESFDTVVVPHLDAGYRLARWLMRDADDAQDVVQE